MSTIYVHNIRAFDAANANIITFGYSGSQCIKNKIAIFDNKTNTIVYEDVVTSFDLAHNIPANILTNGNSYYCIIIAYYMVNNDEYSIASSPSNVFMCLSTPVWKFVGISEGSVVGNSYCDFSLNYSQAQNEEINEYHIVIYTASHSVFWSSESLYDVKSTTRVTGLVNDEVYYIRAYGVTVNGLSFDTRIYGGGDRTYEDIRISVDYISPTIYSLAYLESNKWQGWVKIFTNVSSIEGRSGSAEDVAFIDNEYVDLTKNTDSVIFNDGVLLGNNCTLEWLVYNVAINKPLFITSESGMVITLRRGVFDVGDKVFADLQISGTDYVIYSSLIEPPSSTDIIHFWVQRNSGLYSLKIKNMGGE